VTRYLLDTGVAGDYVSDRRDVPKRCRALVRAGHKIGLCPPVYGELVGGIEMSQTRDENLKKLLRVRSHFSMWPFDEDAALEYARVWAQLNRIGRVMQQIDMQIAAIALSRGRTTVLTYDSDLSDVPSLSVENWLKTP
jgi:tRNA(fMet)-specific endonuclease VapC